MASILENAKVNSTEKMLVEYVTRKITDRVSADVAKNHDSWWFGEQPDCVNVLNLKFKIACKCGFSKIINHVRFVNAKTNLIKDIVDSHIDELAQFYSPTLQDLTELGWFDTSE